MSNNAYFFDEVLETVFDAIFTSLKKNGIPTDAALKELNQELIVSLANKTGRTSTGQHRQHVLHKARGILEREQKRFG